jgi:hypothetical protein
MSPNEDRQDALSWLPADLAHVALRLGRADELEYQLGRVAFKWSSGGGGPLTLEQVHGSTPDTVDAVVTAVRPIPPIAAILFSEAINHLRAVLDNVVFHLVASQRGAPLTDNAARQVAMPIFEADDKFHAWQKRVRKNVPELDSGTLIASRIESLQPYNSTDAAPSLPPVMAYLMGVPPECVHPLLLLQGYSNEDKHRAIRLAFMRSIVQRSDQPFFASDLSMQPVEVGDVLATTTVGNPVMLESQAALHVKRPGTSTWVSPGIELHSIHAYVAEVAIPTLVTGARNATPPLPWSMELGDNGEPLNARITNGGNVAGHIRAGDDALRFTEENQTPPQVLKMPPKR